MQQSSFQIENALKPYVYFSSQLSTIEVEAMKRFKHRISKFEQSSQ